MFSEEIAALNLAKFRKVQTELGKKFSFELYPIEMYRFVEDSAERADLAENQLGKLRAKSRSSVSMSRTSPGVSLNDS